MSPNLWEDSKASISDINNFLQRIKKLINTPGGFQLVPREKNMKDIARLGLMPKHEISTLSFKEYDRGPLPDKNGSGYVWEFIKDVDDIKIYIKLKIDERRGCICISIHESNGPCRLPYKEH